MGEPKSEHILMECAVWTRTWSAMMFYGLMRCSMPMKETSAKSRPKNSGTSCVETVPCAKQGVTITPINHMTRYMGRCVNAVLAKVTPVFTADGRRFLMHANGQQVCKHPPGLCQRPTVEV